MRSGEEREFYLSADSGVLTMEIDQHLITERWMPIMVERSMFLAFIMIAGERGATQELEIGDDIFLDCAFAQGLPAISPDGLVVTIGFVPADEGQSQILASLPICAMPKDQISVRYDLGLLRGKRGRFYVDCGAGPLGDPIADWLAITKFVIGRSDRLGLLSARSHPSWRTRNEAEHFATVYDHGIYAARERRHAKSVPVSAARVISEGWTSDNPPIREQPGSAIVDQLLSDPRSAPLGGENVYDYGHRLLTNLIGRPLPNFVRRLKRLAKDRQPVRFLSLCSGVAGVERSILSRASVPVEITLFDVNRDLLERAARDLAPYGEVRAILGDINRLRLESHRESFDVVVVVSGMHHVVELEIVLLEVTYGLVETGELWIIGEQIGRNGSRLWPEAAVVANQLFSTLPAELRYNHYTGTTDDRLPDWDASSNSFEGIRSSEIDSAIAAYFDPVEVYQRNCFLWRFLEPAYFANYQLTNEAHRRIIFGLLAAEYALWNSGGGRPAESHGIYRKKPSRRDRKTQLTVENRSL